MEFQHPAVEASYRYWLATTPDSHLVGYGAALIVAWTLGAHTASWLIVPGFGIMMFAFQMHIIFLYQSNSASRKLQMWGWLYVFSMVLFYMSRSALRGGPGYQIEDALGLAMKVMLACSLNIFWWLTNGLTVGFAFIPHFPWLVMLLFLEQKWGHTPGVLPALLTWNATTGMTTGPEPHMAPHVGMHVAGDELVSLQARGVGSPGRGGLGLLIFLVVEGSFWWAFARCVYNERRRRHHFLSLVDYPKSQDVRMVSVRPLIRRIAVFQALIFTLLFAYQLWC